MKYKYKGTSFDSNKLLEKASKCKKDELKILLKQVESFEIYDFDCPKFSILTAAIEKVEEVDRDLFMAKTIITARLLQ